jgi:hypothetical protein
MIVRNCLAFIALVAVAIPAPALDTPLGAVGADGSAYAGAAARTVRSLVEYTRWPQPPSPVQVCVAGPASHAAQIDGTRLTDARFLQRRNIAVSGAGLAGCDVLYIGKVPIAGQRQLTAAVRGKGVLTIAEADPNCQSEAMFCLVYQPRGLSFRLNIDAVSRSGLKVDPRVLRLSLGGG